MGDRRGARWQLLYAMPCYAQVCFVAFTPRTANNVPQYSYIILCLYQVEGSVLVDPLLGCFRADLPRWPQS